MSNYRKTMADALREMYPLTEETQLDEATMSSSQIARLKKAYEPMRDKKISTSNADKLSAMMDKVGKDKEALIQLFKADIPFVSQSAATKLITKHNMKGAEINKLREDVDLDEAFSNIFAEETFTEELYALDEDGLNEYLESLDEEEFVALEEFISLEEKGLLGKLGKLAWKGVKKGAKRMTTQGKADAADKKANKLDAKAANKERIITANERILAAKERLKKLKDKAREAKTPEAKKAVVDAMAKAKESGKKAVDAKKDAVAAATEQKENYSMERMGVSKDLVNSVRDVLMGKRPVEVDEGDKEEYQKFFQAALKKFGVGSPAEFKSDEEKKKFFDYIEKNWTKDEK